MEDEPPQRTTAGPRLELTDPLCGPKAYPRYYRGLSQVSILGDMDLVFPPENKDVVEGRRTFLEGLSKHAYHFLRYEPLTEALTDSPNENAYRRFLRDLQQHAQAVVMIDCHPASQVEKLELSRCVTLLLYLSPRYGRYWSTKRTVFRYVMHLAGTEAHDERGQRPNSFQLDRMVFNALSSGPQCPVMTPTWM